jgi:hypothetical protein
MSTNNIQKFVSIALVVLVGVSEAACRPRTAASATLEGNDAQAGGALPSGGTGGQGTSLGVSVLNPQEAASFWKSSTSGSGATFGTLATLAKLAAASGMQLKSVRTQAKDASSAMTRQGEIVLTCSQVFHDFDNVVSLRIQTDHVLQGQDVSRRGADPADPTKTIVTENRLSGLTSFDAVIGTSVVDAVPAGTPACTSDLVRAMMLN